MPLKKQAFYEGAALHQLAHCCGPISIRHAEPFFVINEIETIYLKYCTRVRSPWGFSFTEAEQDSMTQVVGPLTLGLICGSDGIVTLHYSDFKQLVGSSDSSAYISCFRKHDHHYVVRGPEGRLARRVSPSTWKRFLKGGAIHEASRSGSKSAAETNW